MSVTLQLPEENPPAMIDIKVTTEVDEDQTVSSSSGASESARDKVAGCGQ